MALLDFLNKRKKGDEEAGEMSFIDHLEELRWHVIRSVVAILIGAIVVFIYARDIVDKVIFAPADKNFVTYKLLCDMSHWLGMGDAVCLAGVDAKFQSNTMTGQCILGILEICKTSPFSQRTQKNPGGYFLGISSFFCRRFIRLLCAGSFHG